MNRLLGRTFLHPLYDYLLIGGGLSLIVIPFIWLVFGDRVMFEFSLLPWFILLSNSAHFAASTVRLYTKPGTQEALPFLTMIFPLIALGIVTVALFVAEDVGRYFQIFISPGHHITMLLRPTVWQSCTHFVPDANFRRRKRNG